ncbi:hypothetical protein M3194_12585 [Paenibacillus glycanilyticus]|uniref:hypothetical protein n=1 Tax=Paenibacillus glycanilyticus TaxID=126569 RepID=UPI00203C8744|nr:hypothetical protein [Paenibacillus glycanilyticus]MCM3628201.1 hypothetical protein [Paenibacillus glycanilyticus]
MKLWVDVIVHLDLQDRKGLQGLRQKDRNYCKHLREQLEQLDQQGLQVHLGQLDLQDLQEQLEQLDPPD